MLPAVWRLCSAGLLLAWLAAPSPGQTGSVIPPPWVDPQLNPCSPQSWQLVSWPPDGRCYQIYQRGPCNATMELSWDRGTGQPVCVCPDGHLHHADTGRCYPALQRGPCPAGHYLSGGPPGCRPLGHCPAGSVFWPADGQCHRDLTQGPCGPGQLIHVHPVSKEPRCGCDRRLMARSYWDRTDSCYQQYSRGPCPRGLVFVYNSTKGAVECGCNRSMLENYDRRTGQCFPQGKRGPCPDGNIFVFNNLTRSTECRCEKDGLVWTKTGACYRSYTQGPCPHGQFLAPRPEAPHQGVCVTNPCLRGELYFPQDRFCHRIGRRGPCPLGELVQYEQYRGISYRGHCGCTRYFTRNFWPEDGKCYQLDTQGPCPPMYTFVFNRTAAATECLCDRRRGRVRDPVSGACFEPYAPAPVGCPEDQVMVRTGDGLSQCECPAGTFFEARLHRCVPMNQEVLNMFDFMRVLR